ncbi:MAG: molybdopterin-binding protein [Pseudomonadota bacterium]|nr:molybdopterin-binding protein [Pseudomonadota bacterium]
MKTQNRTSAAILIIGNEILSGRTKDLNGNYLAVELLKLGINVRQIRIVPDEKKEIVGALNALKIKYTYVFTSGGIGPTHDDITADSVAEAFSVPLLLNEKAREMLASHYANGKDDLNEARLRMARIPAGATFIDNPISKAPGFRIGNVFVLAGVPRIFQAMADSILTNLDSGDPIISKTITISKPEGTIAEKLAEIASSFPEVSIGSYPFNINGDLGTNLVVMHEDAALIRKVVAQLSKM